MTLINQIEMHSGKPVILRLRRGFELRHGIARMIERDLWLTRDRARPDYTDRPWLFWSANSQFVSEASEAPIEWMVVQR
jgi:lysozyme